MNETGITSDSRVQRDTHLHGYWLLFTRIAWVGLVIFSLGVFLVSLPVHFAHYQTICSGAACDPSQLSPDSAKTLQGFGLSVTVYAAVSLLLAVAYALVWFGVALLIVLRKSNDWMALLVGLMLVMQGANITIGSLYDYPNWLFPSLLESYLSFVLLFLVLSLFPDGHFVPGWTRWLVVGWTIASAPTLSYNPTLFPLWLFLLCGSLLGLGGAQIYRYFRVSNGVQRQQTKWVLFSITITIVVEVGLASPPLFLPSLAQNTLYGTFSSPLGSLIPILIPLSIGIAILRYRLWDIDLIINRTLVYGTLTAILTLIYVGLILLLQALLRGIISQNSDVAIVISTLVIAALFQPFRQRIQQVIDRRFYRRKYDAAKTLEAFRATLRNEVDLSQLREHLITVVQDTMQPSHVSLWLRPSEQQRTRHTPWRANTPDITEGK